MLKGKVTIQEQEVSGNYKFVGIPMYMTKGFQETFGEETNAVAFTAHMLLLEKYPNDADYFQVFLYSYPDGKEVKYEVYAVCIVEDTSESYNKFYENDDAYLKYLQYIKSIARYDTGVKVTAQTQLVSLSTCTNVTETQRLLVHGVKVEEPVPEGQAEEMPAEQTTGEKQ